MDFYLGQTENEPTVDDLLAGITDGKDDLELDAYYIDDDAMTIYLFQSKYHSKPGNLKMADLANFLDVPNKLAAPQILIANSNEKILEFAPTFRRRVLDGYELQLVYLTTWSTTQQLRARTNAWSNERLELSIGGDSVSVPHLATMVDIGHLVQLIDSLSDPREVELALEIDKSEFHESWSGGFKCLIATLRLTELAEIFDRHRYTIFRYNPRGPLGAVAVNKEIRATLADENRRERFQLMNNGLSATCTAFTVSDLGNVAKVNVRDFQIVNGCQTTYSVWNHWRRAGELGSATVTLKLVEDQSSQLRNEISAASNKQSQMKDWDFLFDLPDQERLHREFLELVPPLFYELRRGQYKFMSGGSNYTSVKVKDIAQTMLAFIGSPGEAKDKIRDVPRSKSSLSGVYGQVFFSGVEAERLRLPWLVYERVQSEWKRYSDETNRRGDEREYGRLHILWLIGRSIVWLAGASSYQQLPIEKVRELTRTLDEWFSDHHRIAVDVVNYVVDVQKGVASASRQQLQLRPLFRSAENYQPFIDRHDLLLQSHFAKSGPPAMAKPL